MARNKYEALAGMTSRLSGGATDEVKKLVAS